MGSCISISSRCTHNDCKENGKEVVSSRFGSKRFRGKRSKATLADLVVNLQSLPSIPNRIFANGKSQTSCVFTQQGHKGINQDAMLVWEDFMPDDVTFCGVFDGHGPHGHLVARKVRDALPLKIQSFLHSQSRGNAPGRTCFNGNAKKQIEDADTEKDGSAEENVDNLWREAFLKSYKSMDKELRSHPKLDCFCSGSTAVTIVKQGLNLFMGYIGDSRAILASKGSNDSIMAIQLTVDLKPDLPREAERIKRCKGRVFALQDEPEVCRVWLPFDDAPGLAMARAFGDFCLKEYGVISIPEFAHRNLTQRDLFVVLGSDGVWDVLSNEEVVEIVSSAPTRSSAARMVVDSAAREWKLKYPTSKMDDCAVVCLFLDGKMDTESDYDEQGFSSATLQSNHSVIAMESDSEPTLQRNFTVRSTEETNVYKGLHHEAVEENVEIDAGEDQNWLGLEGVTRVNSLVQLPRYSGERPKS